MHNGKSVFCARALLSGPSDELTSVTLDHGGLLEPRLEPASSFWTTDRDGAVRLRMDATGPAADPPITVHQMFQRNIKRFGGRPALAQKKDGVWETITHLEYHQQCRAAAKSFLKLGLERYHGVGILGFNSPEWFIADVGAIMAGGFAVGIYTTNSPEACQYVAGDSNANILVVENPRQLDKILQIQHQLPHLKAIVQYHDELKEKRPNLYTWKEFIQLGKDVPDSQLDDIIASQKANQCCTLIYTSGTTGQPKGVMLSHDNVTWLVKQGCKALDVVDQEVLISYLPLSHVAAQFTDLWLPIFNGGTTYFADPDALKGSLITTLREVRPTAFIGVPRVWEKIQEQMEALCAKSSLIQRKVAAWAKSVGLQASYNRMNGISSMPWGYTLADILVFRRVHAALGLDRYTRCYSGAAPITRDTLEFFMSLNLPVMELYGMSESAGPHTVAVPSAFRIMSTGKEIPGCRTQICRPEEDGTGEVCFWGRHVFMGYLNMEEKTKEALDEEGWLHTGDLGKLDQDGYLFITGRIKDLIFTAGGENIPPIPIEDAIKEELPIISSAMLIGDKMKFLSMLLTLKCKVDADTGEPKDELTSEAVVFCQQLGSSATRVSEVVSSRDPAIYTAIQEGVDRVNRRATSNAQRVQKWSILGKDFSLFGGELGPTLKLKRPFVLKMYEEEIENFYKD
ncbi:long-chain-fatty-acid--CoA ligase ACSBG2-like [Lissotriton helveticus]